MDVLQRVERAIDNGEGTLVNLVAKIAPWLAPLPTAYLVYAKSITILYFPHLVGLVAGLVIECLGLASVNTALTLREYNASRRKSDPRAPFVLALALALVYFVSVVILTIVLELVPGAATIALVIFPFLSLAGATILALRADHRRRVGAIAEQKVEQSKKRQEGKADRDLAKREAELDRKVQEIRDGRAELGRKQAELDQEKEKLQEEADRMREELERQVRLELEEMRRNAKETILESLGSIAETYRMYAETPQATQAEVAEKLNTSERTIRNHLVRLEAEGLIRRNGKGVEVLA